MLVISFMNIAKETQEGRLSKDKKKGSDWHGVPLPSRKAMEEGAQHGKELVGKAEPHVKNAMEEGVKHGNELVGSAKPHVEKAMKEGVKHGNELVENAKPLACRKCHGRRRKAWQ